MIKFKLGEFVRFVEERREGYVTRIIDDETVAVTDQDGFEIPVLQKQLTRVHGHDEKASSSANEQAEVSGPAIENGIFLTAITDKRASNVVHFTIENTTTSICMVGFQSSQKGKVKGEFAGLIQPETSAPVFSASLSNLDEWPEFLMQVLKHPLTGIAAPPPTIFKKRFRARDFAGEKRPAPLSKAMGWLFQLDESPPIIDAAALKESFYNTKVEPQKVAPPKDKVDLHIEQLREDHAFLDSREIFEIQMSHFKKNLDAAIVHNLPGIIFIHGVGNGKLRDEIHRFISKHQQVRTFRDAQKEKFGFGATEVVFK